MPVYDCGAPECDECQRAFGPDRTKAIANYHARERAYAAMGSDVITLETLKQCSVKQRAHGHGDGMFFYTFQCVEHPRLTRYDLYTKNDRSVKSTWRVDGADVTDLAQAAEKLNAAPTLSDEERALLASVPTDWTPCAPGTRGDRYKELYSLNLKGLVEWSDGKYRLCGATP